MKTVKLVVIFAALVSLLLASCNTTSAPAAILKVTGGAADVSLTANDIKGKGEIEVEYTAKDGTTTKFTGTPLKNLISAITEANTLTFIAKDGYSAEMSGADFLKCETCIASFQDDGGVRLVMPGFPGKLQVKDLIEIKIK